MLEGLTIAARLAAVGGSVAFHAGFTVALIAAGHASSSAANAPNMPSAPNMESAELTAPELDAPLPTPAAPQLDPPVAPPPPAHTHSYPVLPSHNAAPHDPSLVHLPLAPSPTAHADEHAAAPDVLAASAGVTQPRFMIVIGRAPVAPGGVTASQGASETPGGEPLAVPESGVDVPARLLMGGVPSYPPQASEAAIEADVPLEIVVDARGRVVGAHALTHAGYGLDDAAERTVRSYRFAPAIRQGHATPVRMKWTMLFRLH